MGGWGWGPCHMQYCCHSETIVPRLCASTCTQAVCGLYLAANTHKHRLLYCYLVKLHFIEEQMRPYSHLGVI